MDRQNFYSELPTLTDLSEITDQSKFSSVPADWQIVISDVVGSTRAVQQGRYKEVNLIGAATIVALLNLNTERQLPFVFGGDGAVVLIPPDLLSTAKTALLGVQKIAEQKFRLKLRVGIVPVHEVTKVYELRIAKLRVSQNYDQAILQGGALSYAEALVKQKNSPYLLDYSQTNFHNLAVDLGGLECRWQDIPSPQDEVLTLIIKSTDNTLVGSEAVYGQAIAKISSIYGTKDEACPVQPRHLHLTFADNKLQLETKLRTRNWWQSLLYLWRIKLENLLGWLFMRFSMQVGNMDWGQYKLIVTQATDYKKFDDALRLVIASTIQQRNEILDYLEEQYQLGKLVYGFHISNRSLMTCLVFERNGQQVHFIDGADGGYTYASKALKQRLRSTLVKS
jgi:hypothetical protein